MDKLYEIAYEAIKPTKLVRTSEAGNVAAALETESGKVYTGINIDMPCALGMCAEQAAIAEMLKDGQTRISKIAAVHKDGTVFAPCGKCREFIVQVDDWNINTEVLIEKYEYVELRVLLPERWDKTK